MHNNLFFKILVQINFHFPKWSRYSVAGILSLFSIAVSGQQSNPSDTVRSGLQMYGGAQIISSDEHFNEKIISASEHQKNYVANQKDGRLILVAAQTVALSKKASKTSLNDEPKDLQSSTQITQIVKCISKNQKQSQKYSFKNSSSNQRFFLAFTQGRDCINFNNFSQLFSKAAAVCQEVYVKGIISDRIKLSWHIYNSCPYDYCFSNIYSVRPPPYLDV